MENKIENQEIQIKDSFTGGEYANAMQVVHGKEEFVITFFNIVPPSGRVCGKIIASPGHIKRMISVLGDNLKKYEAQFGPVEQAESPKPEIGFQTK
jgi:hypothetical protein